MKRILAFILLLSCASAVFAQSGKSIYQKYQDSKYVSSIFVSPSMFQAVGSLPKVEFGDVDINFSSVLQSLDGMYVLECDNFNLSHKIHSEIKALVSAPEYELMLAANDDGEKSSIYIAQKDGIVTSFILVTINEEDLEFVCLEGKMQKSDLQKLLGL